MGRHSLVTAGGRGSALRTFALALALLAAGLPLPGPAQAENGWGACLDCHEDPDLELTTARGETLKLEVSAAELRASAHRGLACRDCHPAVNLDDHPQSRTVASLEGYRTDAARACLGCHSAAALARLPSHAPLASASARPVCTGCHGSHGISPVAAWRDQAGTSGYCLGCHGRGAVVPLADGRSAALDVDASGLSGSVHAGHDCADCHAGFSAGNHPSSGAGALARDGMAASRICAACHAEKFEQAEGSVHFALLRSGSTAAPGCGDCHEPHAVTPRERYATITGMPCRRCHEEIFQAYSSSMHGMARSLGGHLDAPLCADCHRAHDVSGEEHAGRVRAACQGCHPEAAARHEAWLPNAELHLGAVACVACHAPEAERAVALRVIDPASGRTLTAGDVGRMLGGEAGAAFDPGGNGIDGMELWTALRAIGRSRGTSGVALEGRLEVPRGVEAHRLRAKNGAVRRCETCHEAGAFGAVTVRLADSEGRARHYAADPGLLVDAASAVPVKGFYALGATRIGVLDWLLVLAVLGGLSLPMLHGGARVLAARRAHKGGN